MSYFNYPTGSNDGGDSDGYRSLMDDIEPYEWKLLMEYVYVISFQENETIFEENTHDRSMCILLVGEAIVLKSQPIIGRKMVDYVTEGHIFGEIAFFNNKPRIATILATTNGKYIKMPFDAYLRLVNDHPLLASKIVMNLSIAFASRNRHASKLVEVFTSV
ncbi:MAG: cyclic nucleotide-binding domain-containing protein [Alphaproteobacteria bacterium]|nr:cyclic nucleotide-binding domain-containing protein [Alphaproteobacteria bacterium]